VLRELAQRYLANLRTPIDWVARYGGEEFIIVLPDCGLEDAVQLAQRLRVLTQSAPVQVAGRELHLTASFGVAQFDQGESAAQLLARADAALYRAKAAGRDRVCQDDFAGTGNTVPAGLLTGAE
jgi:diguanylate cyclase (GGDEF)-like protein